MNSRYHRAALLNLFLPQRCLVCDRITSGQKLCFRCALPEPTLPAFHCMQCYAQIVPRQTLCSLCQHIPLPYSTVRFLWEYAGNQRDAICFLKYSGKAELAMVLGEKLIQYLEVLYESAPEALNADCIVPLPVSPKNFRTRGFHHTLGVADVLSKEIFGKRVPLRDLLGFSYTGKGIPQASLPHSKRVQNVTGGFFARESVFCGRQVLIVEDVVTTGATLYNAASALWSAGVKRIDVLSLTMAAGWKFNRQTLAQSLSD